MSHSPLAFIKLKILNATNKTKAILFNVSDSATASTTMTIESAHTADRTVTIPNVTGTLESQAYKGQADGYASLGSDSLVPAAQTQPDIQKYANLASFPGTGSIKLIYMAQDTGKMYQWTGSAYTEVGGGTGAVNSIFGRTGIVTAQTGDYNVAKITDAVAGAASTIAFHVPRFTNTSGKSIGTTGLAIDSFDNLTGINHLTINGNTELSGSLGVNGGNGLGSTILGGDHATVGGGITIGGGDGATTGGEVLIFGGASVGTPGDVRIRLGTNAAFIKFEKANGTAVAEIIDTGIKITPTNQLTFVDDDNSNYIKFKGPNTATESITYSLPPADGGAGDVLTTDGSGILTFSPPSTGFTFTDWTSFVVTNSPVNANISCTGIYRQIGNALDIKYFVKILGGTGSGNPIRFQIPPGFTIDTTKLSDPTTNNLIELGNGTLNFVSSNYGLKGYFYDSSPDQIALYYLDHSTVAYTQMTDNSPGSLAAGVYFVLNCYGISVV